MIELCSFGDGCGFSELELVDYMRSRVRKAFEHS